MPWKFSLFELEDDCSTGGPSGLSTAPFDLQELAIKVSSHDVTTPIHCQFPRLLNITIANADAANAVTLNILDGKTQKAYSVAKGQAAIFPSVIAQSFWFTGNGSSVISYAVSWPQKTDPNSLQAQTLAAISGTVAVSGLNFDGQGNLDVNVQQPTTVSGSVKTFAEPS